MGLVCCWLGALRGFNVRFIVRWKTNVHLVDAAGIKQAAWKIPPGKPGLAPRRLFDAVRHCNVQGSVLFFPVTHPDYPDWSLTLVVGRRKGGQPWYLVSNEVVQTPADAWNVVIGRDAIYGKSTFPLPACALRWLNSGWPTRVDLCGERHGACEPSRSPPSASAPQRPDRGQGRLCLSVLTFRTCLPTM
jgi:hypothetical protein